MTGQERMNIGRLRAQERQAGPARVRWYQGYSGRGKADQLIEGISRYMQQRRLTDTVCGLRVERRARGEFYFFLTLETEDLGVLPDDVQEALADCPFLQFGAGGPYELTTIQSMVSGELRMKALGQCLTYRVLRQEQAGDPFQADLHRPDRDSEFGEVAERVLWYASSLGSGRWSAFHAASVALGAGEQSRQIARALRLLGHLEVSDDGEQWSVAPAAVAEVEQPGGDRLHFHAGCRSPHSSGERDGQWGGPARLRVRPELTDAPLVAAPGRGLASALPSLADFRESLLTVGGVSTARHTFARFDGLSFQKGPVTGEPGLYEVTGPEGRTLTLLHSGGHVWRRGDWYGLRYLTLEAAGLLLDARYDAARWQFALPEDQRPPELYERALVLCSGLLPTRAGRWLVYHNVAPDVARHLTGLLGCAIAEQELNEGVPA